LKISELLSERVFVVRAGATEMRCVENILFLADSGFHLFLAAHTPALPSEKSAQM
jgi:hypothetical protein